MRHQNPSGRMEFAVHEVYFDIQGAVISWTPDAVSPRASTVDALRKALRTLLASGEEEMVLGDLRETYPREDVEWWIQQLDIPPLEYRKAPPFLLRLSFACPTTTTWW